MNGFDEVYSGVTHYFGSEPDPLLERHVGLIRPDTRVLDIGCGQGRNAVYIARQGFTVDALDPSEVALEQVNLIAAEQRLAIRTIHGGFADLIGSSERYGTILALGLIPLLSRDEITSLVQMVERTLEPNGTVFVTAFGTWDPSYPDRDAARKEEGTTSFRSIDGSLGTFLEPGEIVELFPFLEVVDHDEFLGPEHRHGDGPAERHGRAEAVFRAP